MSESSLTERARERGQVIVWLDDVQTQQPLACHCVSATSARIAQQRPAFVGRTLVAIKETNCLSQR
jgi:hypothetical protein